MDPGIEDDLLLAEPSRNGSARIPRADHIVPAVVSGTGPYAPSLQAALALGSDDRNPCVRCGRPTR